MSKRISVIILFMMTLLTLLACSNDKEDLVVDKPEQTGAPLQIVITFAPGQLGDKGYADNVMNAIGLLEKINETSIGDTLDIQFISSFNSKDSRKVLASWAQNPANPIYQGEYSRRLLVLTENFMINWLDDIKDDLRPTDEVLLLKVNEDDVKKAAQTYGLENRIHGLNISVAASIRKFCRFMDQTIELNNMENWESDIVVNRDTIHCYRLFGEDMVSYRDSVIETLTQEVGSSSVIRKYNIISASDEDDYSVLSGSNLLQKSYLLAKDLREKLLEQGDGFAIIDMGTANAGWNFYIMDQYPIYNTLVIDGYQTQYINNSVVNRYFDRALDIWGREWISQPAASMPQMRCYINGEMCYDNIPDFGEFLE